MSETVPPNKEAADPILDQQFFVTAFHHPKAALHAADNSVFHRLVGTVPVAGHGVFAVKKDCDLAIGMLLHATIKRHERVTVARCFNRPANFLLCWLAISAHISKALHQPKLSFSVGENVDHDFQHKRVCINLPAKANELHNAPRVSQEKMLCAVRES